MMRIINPPRYFNDDREMGLSQQDLQAMNRRALCGTVAFAVSIEKHDIIYGKACNTFECPVALATQRAYGLTVPMDSVSVSDNGEVMLRRVNERSPGTLWFVPIEAAIFIHNVDEDYTDEIAPFSFRMSKDLGNHDEYERYVHGHPS